MTRSVLTALQKAEIKALRRRDAANWTYRALATRFGCSRETISHLFTDDFSKPPVGPAGVQHKAMRERIEQDAREHLSNLPEDTRDYTQRFFGDPLPGRSALDRARAGA